MKRFIFLSFFQLLALIAFSQDVILLNSGSRINCKVTSIDSLKVYYSFNINGIERNSFVDKSRVKEIQYQPYQNENIARDESLPDYRQCITIGILQGGGSLIGADLELKLTDRFAVQAGAGFIGFGAGLNLHFKPTLRSSCFSLQYWHQGYGDTYTQSLIGPSIVIRGKRWLSAQIGLAALIESGPGWPDDQEQPSTMLTYALGFYLPW
jgi:hypothetical protein